MSELLLELFSEEIPAAMQSRAADDLRRLVTDGLKDAGLTLTETRTYSTPRRIVLVVDGLPKKSPDIRDERKGPRVGSPVKAIEGFVRGAGLGSIDEAEVRSDPKKGEFYVAVIDQPGKLTSDILAVLVPEVIAKFPWPKSMRWGSGRLKWVRPLHSIVCLLDGKPVDFTVDKICSFKKTYGHRFMAPKAIQVKNFADYNQKLRDAFVILDEQERVSIIDSQARKLAKDKKLKLVEDAGLLKENAGLTEWPTVLLGEFDKSFLDVPSEVLTTAMKKHQKYFSLKKGQKLSNHFLLVSNLVADDGGNAIVEGNERVIRARLSDAKFFWEQDKKQKLDDLLPRLGDIIFHEKLGTQAERVERLKKLAREIAPLVGADRDKAERAAELCKADLVTAMVGEFPDLQGLMGRYYALEQGETPEIAQALEEHYRPQGPNDAIPQEPLSLAVALADKLDTLIGFWAIDEKPTGSKDPYALRRAALGVIRLVLENEIRLPIARQASNIFKTIEPGAHARTKQIERAKQKLESGAVIAGGTVQLIVSVAFGDGGEKVDQRALDLLSFFADRLKVYLRDQGARHDLIDAVFSLGGQDDLLMIVKRVEALGSFLDTDDGENLLAGVKRSQNILRIEEKKDDRSYNGEVDGKLLKEREEKDLHKAIIEVARDAGESIAGEDFEGAMSAISRLRAPVDAFFDNVTVNAEDKQLRENRLNLLSGIRRATLRVADFTKIEG